MTARAFARRIIPPRVYARLTRLERWFTLRLPVAGAALLAGRLRLRVARGPVGVDRLDAIVVINLRERGDRMSAFTDEMAKLGISTYSRFEAIRDVPGILGCTRSHAACVSAMIERGDRCWMICEDDARFLVSRAELDVLVQSFLDDDADAVCLAYHHLRPPMVYNRLFVRSAGDTRTSACYLLKSSIAADLLDLLEEGIAGLRAGGDRMKYGVDMIWEPLHHTHVFLLPVKRAVRQEDGYSDVEQKLVSYGGV